MSNSKVLHVICIHCVLSPSKDTDISLRPKCYNCQLTVVTRKQHHQSFVPRHLFTYTSHRFGPPACQSARPSICSALFVPARSSIRPSKPRPWRRQSHLFRPAAHRLPPVPAAPDRLSIHVSHARGHFHNPIIIYRLHVRRHWQINSLRCDADAHHQRKRVICR